MYTEQKNNKKLKELYRDALTVKSAIPHPRCVVTHPVSSDLDCEHLAESWESYVSVEVKCIWQMSNGQMPPPIFSK